MSSNYLPGGVVLWEKIRNQRSTFFAYFEKDKKIQRKFLGHERYDEIKLCMNKLKRKYMRVRVRDDDEGG